MEIIEKEKVKEIPAQEYCDRYGGGYGRRDVNGKANAGLTLGIIGTALGAWALFGNNRGGLFGGGALGGGGVAGGGSTNINVNGIEGYSNGVNAPTAFQAWEKGCQDTLNLQSGLYNWALTQQNQRFQDRQTIDQELFGVYKAGIDADFNLYKSTRDGFDILAATHNKDLFALYKEQRDNKDELWKEISDLKAHVAANDAIRPYQDKLLQCEIAGVKTAAAFNDERIVNYIDKLDCRNIKGVNCLPDTPTVTGYIGNPCGCACAYRAASPTTPTA